MTGFVVDASVAIAWLFEDEVTPETEAVLDHLSDQEGHALAISEIRPRRSADSTTLATSSSHNPGA